MEVFTREVLETLIAAAVIAGATTVRIIQVEEGQIPDDETLARGAMSLVDHPKAAKAREFAKVLVDLVISSAKGRAVVREEDLN